MNRKNAADRRVYELLDQKFRLFEGVFGSSDDVLGSIESGVDFEKRIASIYQTCKTAEAIQAEFDRLQEELSDQIQERMTQARQSILENFDEEVAARLKECQGNTVASLGKFTQWVYYFFLIHGAERVEPLDQWRLKLTDHGVERTYNLKWKDAEEEGDVFLRREDPLYASWLTEALAQPLPPAYLRFDHTHSERNISFLTAHPNLRGMLSIDKLTYEGTLVDDETVNRILELPAAIAGTCPEEGEELRVLREQRLALQRQAVEDANKKYYLEECDKLDAYSEDLKEGLQHELKDLKKAIAEKRKAFRACTGCPLAEIVAMKDEINRMDAQRKKMQREIYDREDEIDAEKERLQEEIRQKLQGNCAVEHIMTIGFEII